MIRRDFLKLAPATAMLAACRKSSKIRLALNWKPEPEFGGFYSAPFQQRGLDVDILPGGTGTPTAQMIGAGSTEFGIVEGDEIVLARSQGNPVVGLFAVFETSPLGLMVHAERKVSSVADLVKSGTLAVEKGLPYVRLLQKRYSFDHVRVVPSPGGDLAAFQADPNFAQQVFVTSEPLAAKRKGIDVKVFSIAETGYNPYTNILATSDELLRKDPAMVKAMVEAVRQGWQTYLANPAPADAQMHALNPSMDEETFAAVADAQKPLIESGDTQENGLGTMSKDRWETLIAQLAELGDIPRPIPAADCFRNL